jgi:hypothetical protein
MDPDVIRSIKQAALDLDRTASDIMEEAGKQWLQSKTKKGLVRLAGADHRIIGTKPPGPSRRGVKSRESESGLLRTDSPVGTNQKRVG